MKLVEPTKICTKCGAEKPVSKFYKHKHCRLGVYAECKVCNRLRNIKKYWENPEEGRKNSLYWNAKNYNKRMGYVQKWVENNPAKVAKCKQGWYRKNNIKVKKAAQKYAKENSEKVLKARRKRQKQRRKAEPKFRLNCNMATAIGISLKGNKAGRHWEVLVGYTLEALKSHLEALFTGKMTWNNYGKKGWEIDHKIPISVFNYAKTEHQDFKKCWALDNLQPMWAEDNMSKSNNLTKPFQPSLLI